MKKQIVKDDKLSQPFQQLKQDAAQFHIYFSNIQSLLCIIFTDKEMIPNINTFKRIKNYVYQVDNLLGHGNFSKVFPGKNELDNSPVAIKVIELASLKNPKLQELHRNQREVMAKLNHPNCMKCFDIISSDNNCYMILELCNGGDLDIYAKKKGFLSEDQVAPLLKDILQGLVYLSSLNIVHRDLKVANVLLHNGTAKIADFGFAVFSKQNFKDLSIGSPLYMSPEGYIHNMYGPKTDIWAFGIMVFQLLHGDTPYSHCKLESELKRQLSIPFDRSKVKSSISTDLRQVIFRCLQIIEPKRITAQQLRETAYFKKIYQQLNPTIYRSIQQYNSTVQNIKEHLPELKKVKSIDNLYGQDFNKQLTPTRNSNANGGQKGILKQYEQKDEPYPKRQPYHLPIPNINKVIRLGRPISTKKKDQQLPSSPVPSVPNIRQRFGSIDSKKPVEKYIIFNGTITFKVAVNIIHYCRCMYRYVRFLINANEQDKELRFLSGWILLVLEQLKRKINQNQINFEGVNKEIKMVKFREVRADYERKYSDQLKPYVNGFISKPNLEEVKIFFFLQYRKYDFIMVKEKTQQFYEIGYYSVLLYDVTRLLKKCHQEDDFSRFLNYKDLQEALNYGKQKFDKKLFSWIQKRILINI